jgi:PIN domain nuclease of toxin-antitoxin system
MKLLLDTVALYRAATAPGSLTEVAAAAIADEANQLSVSMVSAWELAIKSSLGKLPLPCSIETFFSQVSKDLLAESLEIDLPSVAKVATLPHHHGDPFDRLIIAQALLLGCTVVTSDPRFTAYGVNVIW